jgi:cobalt-zinc-cadmium efflux system membrane fusion protein
LVTAKNCFFPTLFCAQFTDKQWQVAGGGVARRPLSSPGMKLKHCWLPLAAGLITVTSGVFTGCERAATIAVAPAAEFERQGNRIVIPEKSSLRSRLAFVTISADKTQSQLSAPAVVEADPQKYASIFPPLSGHLTRLQVQLGDTVTNGQLLATLESPDFLAAQDSYVKARSVAELTRRALQRQRELLTNKVAAQKDVEQAASDYESAKSDLDTANQQLLAYGFNPRTQDLGQPLRVFSPLSGQVVDMSSAHGEYRNDATVPLMSVADLSTIWLTASVPEKDLRYLTKGQAINATFAAYPGERITGTILFIGDLVDPDIRVAKVRIAVANPQHRFKPGMFATVNFLGFPEPRVTVPTTAVVQSGEAAFVFEQIEPWVLQPVKVTAGSQSGDVTIITDGLETGASVLVKEGVLFQ